MTPAARVAAAIDILDKILAGEYAERVLIKWGRANRYAGSSDRYEVRDLVFDALRCRQSYALWGGGLHGRGLMVGALRAKGHDPSMVFTGQGYAPSVLTEADHGRAPQGKEMWDIPDWLIPYFEQSLGEGAAAFAAGLRQRAPVFLRVNLAKSGRDAAVDALNAEGIETRLHPVVTAALEVVRGMRRIQNSAPYLQGLVELQDASSQAVIAEIPLRQGLRVLDYCAGAGGKTLAMAAQAPLELYAYDQDPVRLRDLPKRSARAGVDVTVVSAPEEQAPYDLVLIDAPCSGSGSWRRDPQGKWALDPDKLAQLVDVQQKIMTQAASLLCEGGRLAYCTCSILSQENHDQIALFLKAHPDFTLSSEKSFIALDQGDGFYMALLEKQKSV